MQHRTTNPDQQISGRSGRRARGRIAVIVLVTGLSVGAATAWVPAASAAAVGATTSTTTTTKAPRPDEQQVEDLHDLYEDVTAEELATFARYTESSARATDLDNQLKALNVSVTAAEADVVAAQRDLTRTEARAEDLDARLVDTGKQLGSEEVRLRNKAVQAYMGGGERPAAAGVDALVKSNSADEVGRSKAYADAAVDEQRTVVHKVEDLRDSVASLQAAAATAVVAANARREEVGRIKADVQAQHDRIAQLQAEAVAETAQVQTLLQQVAAKRDEIAARLAQAAQRSSSITAALAERQKGQVLPVLTGGIFSMPLAEPHLSSPFGVRANPMGAGLSRHDGLDFSAPTGTPILAPADGTVIVAGEVSGYGNCTMIDHGNGLSTLYGHQSEFKVKGGDVVKRGDVIGLVGSTGNSTGPHLHFEVRIYGVPNDPMPFLGLKATAS